MQGQYGKIQVSLNEKVKWTRGNKIWAIRKSSRKGNTGSNATGDQEQREIENTALGDSKHEPTRKINEKGERIKKKDNIV